MTTSTDNMGIEAVYWGDEYDSGLEPQNVTSILPPTEYTVLDEQGLEIVEKLRRINAEALRKITEFRESRTGGR